MHVVTIASLITCVAVASSGSTFDEEIFAVDPKDNYFRYVRTYNEDPNNEYSQFTGEMEEDVGELPKPNGFRTYYPRVQRVRREEELTTTITPEMIDGIDDIDLDDKVKIIDGDAKPLELDVLDATNDTTPLTDDSLDDNLDDDTKNVVINDFIRFKRDAAGKESAETKDGDAVRKRKSLEPDTAREPRGAVKEQWLKQPYPVQVDPDGGVGELTPNAPRVHFVTQRRSESAPPLVYHSYEREREREREGRSRELTRQRDIDLDRDLEPTNYYPRPARHYGRAPEMYYRERDPRDRDFDRDRDYTRNRPRINPYYNHRDQQDRYYEEDRPIPSVVKQKRIIYYATLPEIVRPPPAGNGGGGYRRYPDVIDRDRPLIDRERDRDRDRALDRDRDLERGRDRLINTNRDLDRDRDNRLTPEDRYATQSLSGGGGSGGSGGGAMNYRFRAPTGGRYDDDEPSPKSGGYPGKVASSDVNVRALKKNPERRIYSEVDRDRRYPQDDGGRYESRSHR